MKEAYLYSKNKDRSVSCFLCRHECRIKEGHRGICNVRENNNGTLYSIFYGKPCSAAIDPIEKKPLYHFYPGSTSLSIATPGCNFKCEFCQNWEISQYNEETLKCVGEETIPSEEIVAGAVKKRCKSISYTYSEPTVFYEYAKDTATLAKNNGIENVFVTNGFMTRKMLDDSKGLISAANVDLKSFSEKTYKKIIKGELKGVLDSIAYMKKLSIWVEITTLVVPGMNDSKEELKEIASFIAETGKEIPWHISKFHPQYKMTDKKVTPVETLETAYSVGKEAGLKYVYLGNMQGDERENTFCWNCGKKLIERVGYSIGKNLITKNSECYSCKSKIDGIF